MGIEARRFEKIFKIFQSLAPRPESTGVGLSLVKKIAERNGDSVRVASTLGEGAAFYFTAPKEPEPAERGIKNGKTRVGDRNGVSRPTGRREAGGS